RGSAIGNLAGVGRGHYSTLTEHCFEFGQAGTVDRIANTFVAGYRDLLAIGIDTCRRQNIAVIAGMASGRGAAVALRGKVIAFFAADTPAFGDQLSALTLMNEFVALEQRRIQDLE